MNVVIGYDINEYYAQISYAVEGQEPETLQFPSQNETGNIETALCKRTDVNQWYCGKEAVKKGVSGTGTLVEHLWALLCEQKDVVIEKNNYPIVSLCNLFLGRTLTWTLQRLEEVLGEAVQVKALVLTSEPWSDTIRQQKDLLTQGLPVPRECIFFQGHEDSLFSYLTHQDERLMGYETGVFDLTGETLISYRVVMNQKTRPVVTTIEKEYVSELVRKKHYASIKENDEKLALLDRELKAYGERFVQGRIVTGLYLLGDGFRGDWYEESRKFLCRNRKVFLGNNLFSKGACFGAMERIWPSEVSEKYIFFRRDMLRYNVGVALWKNDKSEYYPLLDAGTNWYEAGARVTFMMEKAETLELLITPIDGSGTYTEIIDLPEMPARDFRSFRMTLELEMQSVSNLRVKVSDEGFGELFEKIPIDICCDIELKEKGTK